MIGGRFRGPRLSGTVQLDRRGAASGNYRTRTRSFHSFFFAFRCYEFWPDASLLSLPLRYTLCYVPTMDGNIYGGGTVTLTHFLRTARNAREFNPVRWISVTCFCLVLMACNTKVLVSSQKIKKVINDRLNRSNF